MSNMSYCRFENTYRDMIDCNEHLWDEGLSSDEDNNRKWFIELCREVAEQFEGEDLDLLNGEEE